MTSPARQRGASLVEALIAFLVLSLGLVGMTKLQSQLRLNADIARQRSEAVRLAQEDIEGLRSFASLVSMPGVRAYADIAADSRRIDSTPGQALNASFQLQRNVSDGGGFRTASVTVGWNDRSGQSQQVQLQSVIAATPPALSGALTVQPNVQALKRIHGRSAFIPAAATPLGNGTSAWKPVSGGTVVLVFDDLTGELRSTCAAAAGIASADLTIADLSDCTATGGLLLSGIVRRSGAARAEPPFASDAPLPLGVELTLSGATYPAPPRCFSEARKQVEYTTAAGTRRQTVPLAAIPASVGVASWTELNERFVAYHCVVTPLQGRWSGRSALLPQGWSIGSAPTQHKVCRYSVDQDGSGAVDNNAEHPDSYRLVDRPLMQQNFLLVPGDRPCPGTTAQHQP
jgi:Tfp pilus assembly protein PilX